MKRLFTLLLAALLLLSAVGCVSLSCTMPVRYTNAEKYTAGNFTYDEAKVKKVEVEWLGGSITLKNGKGTLSVSEADSESLAEEDRMHWWIDGTTLRIKYCKSGKKLSLSKMEKKDLTLELPAFVDLDLEVASGKIVSESMLDLGRFRLEKASGGTDIRFLSAKEVKIETASGGVDLGKVSVSGEFEVDTASGGLTVDEIAADKIDVDSASGGVAFGRVTADRLDIDSASGSVSLGMLKASTVRIKSTSGGVKIVLADRTAGAKIRFDAVSGSFNTALPAESSGSVYTIGNGLMDVEISVVSGSVNVE